jgi:DNA repair protein SbcD/Mre11
MRLLHTSDWHLGVSHGTTSRGADHDLMLDALLAAIRDHHVDALIVAGDVFDTMQPPAEAQARLFGFLARAAAAGLRQAVLVGGNHDSASRLDAPAAVLRALHVHVVGGIPSEASWDRCVVPLRDAGGAVAAVALAVPYVHEFRLGVRTTDLDTAGVRAAFTERFQALYRELTDRALARFPGVPIVATGHLTIGPSDREDYPQEIHQVGTIEGLPATVLDPRIQYVALGHIHRSYPADEARRAWYCGSPIALSLPEARRPRRALIVDLDPDPAGAPTVTPLELPSPRGLLELRGPPDDLLKQLRALTWSEPLPPLLFCRVVTDEPPLDLPVRVEAALSLRREGQRPILAELRFERATPLPNADDGPAPDLRDLDPRGVFDTLLRARGVAGDNDLMGAFSAILSATGEDFDAMVADARGGPG